MGWIAPIAPEVARAAHTAVVDKFRIHCPFAEKDEAKALGARWSGAHKTWYAPNQETYDQLAKWRAGRRATGQDSQEVQVSRRQDGRQGGDHMLAADDEDEHLFSRPAKKLRKCHAALMHKEPELYPEPPPAPKKAPRPPQELRVWAENVPIFGLECA